MLVIWVTVCDFSPSTRHGIDGMFWIDITKSIICPSPHVKGQIHLMSRSWCEAHRIVLVFVFANQSSNQ